MPRQYTCKTENVTVSAAQDLISITGASGKICRIKRISVGATNTTTPTNQEIRLRCRYLPATVTAGSGGSSITPAKLDQGDAAATFTSRGNDTTPATTSGTAVVLWAQGVNILAGLDYSFEDMPTVNVSTAFVFELLSTVSGTVALSAEVDVEEIG